MYDASKKKIYIYTYIYKVLFLQAQMNKLQLDFAIYASDTLFAIKMVQSGWDYKKRIFIIFIPVYTQTAAGT